MSIVLILILVPLITAFIGYITNWAAVKMIFNPQEFVGVGPIGWQGVLPSKADKFATDVADTATDMISARELAERLDPDEMEKLLEDRLDDEIPELLREAAELVRPGVWDEMVPDAQQMVVEQVRREGSEVAREIFEDLKGISDELLDLHQLIVDLLTGSNVRRLTRLFQELGGKELKWIVYYGGIFGFMVGCVQAGAFSVFDQWWLMPLVGGVVGLGTNYMALQMIFRPLEPKRYLFVEYQGMFPKRQAEIAHDYGQITAREILTPANLLRLITEGEAGTEIARVVLTKVSERIDEQKPLVEMLTQTEVTDEMLMTLKLSIVQRITERVPDIQTDLESYVGEAMDVGTMVEERLARLSKPEFERLLRGLFEEDEWILIVIGGVLGAGVGLLQGLLILTTG